jgi:hypothetical protein
MAMSMYTRLGYIKLDRMAREARRNFWRDTYRAHSRRQLIEFCAITLLLAVLGAAFVYMAFTPALP